MRCPSSAGLCALTISARRRDAGVPQRERVVRRTVCAGVLWRAGRRARPCAPSLMRPKCDGSVGRRAHLRAGRDGWSFTSADERHPCTCMSATARHGPFTGHEDARVVLARGAVPPGCALNWHDVPWRHVMQSSAAQPWREDDQLRRPRRTRSRHAGSVAAAYHGVRGARRSRRSCSGAPRLSWGDRRVARARARYAPPASITDAFGPIGRRRRLASVGGEKHRGCGSEIRPAARKQFVSLIVASPMLKHSVSNFGATLCHNRGSASRCLGSSPSLRRATSV